MIRRIDMPITSRPRAVARIVALAKRVHPIILVFAFFAGVVVATTALRFAIWLPIAFLKAI
jgi:hypothetical protein